MIANWTAITIGCFIVVVVVATVATVVVVVVVVDWMGGVGKD